MATEAADVDTGLVRTVHEEETPALPDAAASPASRTTPAHKIERETGTWAVLATARFGLAMTVLIGHICVQTLHWKWTHASGTWPQMSAVYGFLLISGYCIAASLQRRSDGYFERRVRRIYPVYLAVIIYALLTAPWIGKELPSSFVFLGTLTMLQAFTGVIRLIGQTWSLALEWWCYMVAPLCPRWKWLAWACFGASFAYFLFASPLPFGRMEGLAPFGLAWMWFSGWLFYRLPNRNVAVVLLVFPALFAFYLGMFIGVPYFITVAVLILCRDIPIPVRVRPVLNWLGDLSYPLFMVHGVTMGIGNQLGFRMLGQLSLAFFVAVVTLHLVDYPVRFAHTSKARSVTQAIQ